MFDVTVTAKFLTHAKIKIYRTVANAFLNVCEKIRRFLSRIKNVQKRKLVPFFCLTVYNKAMVHCKLRPRRPAPLARLTRLGSVPAVVRDTTQPIRRSSGVNLRMST